MLRLTPLALLLTAAAITADNAPSQQQQLARLQTFIGSWRGVAQPIRGSAKDSWTEQADWSWDFSNATPALTATLPSGKYFTRFRLTPAATDGDYRLVATTSKDHEQTYSGHLGDQNQLVLLADQSADGLPTRLTFRLAAGGDRLLLLLEKSGPTTGSFARLAEIGYTRAGSGFGNIAQGRECIVTGGLGTIEVTHNGKSYYVCCTGCRDYFNANPDQVLAQHNAKKNGK